MRAMRSIIAKDRQNNAMQRTRDKIRWCGPRRVASR